MCLGIPGRIEEVFAENGAPMAYADFVGERRKICLSYLPDLTVGDFTIVHAGYALTRLDADEAAKTIATMREFGLIEDTPPAPRTVAEFIADQREPDVAAAALLVARARIGGHEVAIAESTSGLISAELAEDLRGVPGPGSVLGAGHIADVEGFRAWAHPGDLLLLACEDAAPATDLLARCGAWGVTVIVACTGQRPPAGLAGSVLECADIPQLRVMLSTLISLSAEFAGQSWLMERPAQECSDEVCITCSDEGRIAEVQRPPATLLDPAIVRTAEGQEEVDVTLVSPVQVGDLIIIHAGSAIGRSHGHLEEVR